jgi:hypothetical protein
VAKAKDFGFVEVDLRNNVHFLAAVFLCHPRAHQACLEMVLEQITRDMEDPLAGGKSRFLAAL